ncbi:MAG: hypothetical protein ISR98_00200 [Parcubacteria group bacterium]|nr:hypothetical protein [Parcubacteria group bacterium]
MVTSGSRLLGYQVFFFKTAFLNKELKLILHPNKVSIHKLHNGIDYLGYIVLPHYKLLRTKTKNRIYKNLKRRILEYKTKKISENTVERSLQSYLGALSHSNSYNVGEDLKNKLWFWLNE